MRKRTVLLISGDAKLLADWRRWLKNWRYYYDVSAAETPEKAADMLKRAPPDLAVLDEAFPGAAEICRERRTEGRLTLVAEVGGCGNGMYWLRDAQADGYMLQSDRRGMFEAKIGGLLGTFPLQAKNDND